ncbi:DUF3592 domain-containing protein [Limibacter armeniacum]|uniref:DUF3592 domain-containing protein n=1 Tax=Limibacter armeniacum TaxID=466084 RepID=UPI002FE526EC
MKNRFLTTRQKIDVILSHNSIWLGMTIALFSGFFAVAFSTDFYLIDEYQLSSNATETNAVLLAIEETNASVNEKPIYKYTFSYLPQERKQENAIRGWSYSTWENRQEGDSVVVRYAQTSPNVAIIKGQSLSMFNGWVLLLFSLISLVAFIIAIVGFRKGLKDIFILEYGKMAQGTLVKTESTGVVINDKPVMRMIFEFSDTEGHSKRAAVKTVKPQYLNDDDKEWLVYMPGEPVKVVMVDTLSKKVRALFNR